MKVLQINSVSSSGSTGRIVQDLDRELTARGHACSVAWGRGVAPTARGIRIGGRGNVLNHVAKTRLQDRHGFGSRRATSHFLDELDTENIDLVHLHNLHGYFINLPMLFTWLKSINKPVVWTLHDCWSFTGHCAYFEYAGCSRWQTGCGRCPERASYPSSWALDQSANNFIDKRALYGEDVNLTIVTPSKWLAGLVEESFLKDHPLEVIENDPSPVFYPRNARSWRSANGMESVFLILAVANIWDRRKGLKHINDLAETLQADERLVAVGSVPKGTAFSRKVRHLNQTESTDELAALYSAADVFINPTMEDNYPTTNLEALACGTPVLTFDTGGSGECITRGRGWLAPTKDSVGLRTVIDRLRNEVDEGRTSLTELRPVGGRTMVERYLGLYERLT